MIRFDQNRKLILLTTYCVGISLGILLAMEPFGFFLAGISAASLAYLFYLELRELPLRFQIAWLLILSQLIDLIVFLWIPNSISAISGSGKTVSWALFLVYGLFSQIKLFLFYFGWKITSDFHNKLNKNNIQSRQSLLFDWASFPIWGTITDLITPQLFPWFWGNLAEGSLSFSQSASWFGIYGIGFFLLWIGASAALLVVKKERILGILGVAIFTFIWILASLRLYSAPEYAVPTKTPALEKEVLLLSGLLVQPNTSPAKRELAENADFIGNAMSKILELSLQAALTTSPPPDLIFLPESAVPFHGTNPNQSSKEKNIYSPTYHGLVKYLSLKTGADLVYNELNQYSEGLKNQVSLISSESLYSIRYDKRRLLPFGEFIPLEKYFPKLRNLFEETSKYVPGDEPAPLKGQRKETRSRFPKAPTVLDLNLIQKPEQISSGLVYNDAEAESSGSFDYQVLPLICYEAMFPELVSDSIQNSESEVFTFLVNPTNDAWFSSSTEAWQHGAASKFRSIEFGLTLVRPAVSGISYAVDPYGRDLTPPLEFSEVGSRSFLLPITRKRKEGNTFYAKIGNLPFYLYSVLLIGFLFVLRKRNIVFLK
ncbi:apolipoprotein N-acyltransferase [Leptospira perolatii]|uniref:Apolipoprotein N-acyltransferase n=1 Tax=Leptospira perolatii TaxID=2023191 RepID=A0A2M9ZT12_9LEPT|nr:nitrilase-related carbon-nitrogen hydrolase [Leptospira perolatii]PJZ68789.1 apolipoprotein N-acyltransferase [Leptospira perolatii]PJZ75144.1 apolipoprotein N-acyltransferase [Leptospira perolatii]